MSLNLKVTKITQEHMRNKVNKDATDEKITKPNLNLLPYSADKIIDFGLYLIREKERLGNEIDKAKVMCGLNIDNCISNNKSKKELCDIFNVMTNIKSAERIVKAQDYKFNNEGNQVLYIYDVKEATTIDFDRNKVRKIYKALSQEMDDISNMIDEIKINTKVDYKFDYDINDKFEDILELYCSK